MNNGGAESLGWGGAEPGWVLVGVLRNLRYLWTFPPGLYNCVTASKTSNICGYSNVLYYEKSDGPRHLLASGGSVGIHELGLKSLPQFPLENAGII